MAGGACTACEFATFCPGEGVRHECPAHALSVVDSPRTSKLHCICEAGLSLFTNCPSFLVHVSWLVDIRIDDVSEALRFIIVTRLLWRERRTVPGVPSWVSVPWRVHQDRVCVRYIFAREWIKRVFLLSSGVDVKPSRDRLRASTLSGGRSASRGGESYCNNDWKGSLCLCRPQHFLHDRRRFCER